MVLENHVAFHDIVTLIGWTDSSSQGPKVKLALASRVALSHFDNATRRRKKQAGQRYQAAISTIDNPPEPLGAMELWFAGANWAHQDGARIAFSVTPEDLEFFRVHTTRDQKADEAFSFWLTLVELDDDENPVNQVKYLVVEEATETLPKGVWDAPPDPILKGGPNSKNVAMLCQDDEFQWFVSEQEDRDEKSDFAQADAFVKRLCGIKSKVEFDHDDTAWEHFIENVRRPFFTWAGRAP